jgi:hypothetical protein
MNEELDQIEKNQTWELVPRPKDKNVVRTKWNFKNRVNEEGQIIRNTERLVCKLLTIKNRKEAFTCKVLLKPIIIKSK